MSNPKVLVTGATGRTGAVVVTELLKAGYPVRAMVRADDARAQALARRGVEIAVADMGDPERVAAALAGVRRAYYLPPVDPAMLHGAAVFATAAKDAGLEHVVLLSQWLASPSHPAFATRQHWLADRLFQMIPGIGLTIVRPGFFADLPYLVTLPVAAQLGVFPWLFGEGLDAPPSVDDIGRVAAAALMDPDRHAGRTYRPTGPALLSGADMAASLGRALERKMRLQPMPVGLFLKAARLDGQPIAVLSLMADYIEEQRRGTFALGAPTDHVRAVTGRAPESFEAVARRRAAQPQNRRTLANFMRQLVEVLAAPVVPAPPIARYRAGLRMPRPAQPQFASESPTWRAERGLRDAGSEPRPAGRMSAIAAGSL